MVKLVKMSKSLNKYRLNKGFISHKINNNVVVFSSEDSILFTFNQTAAYIFQGIKMGWGNEKITKGLVDSYNIPESEARKDIEGFTKDLVKKKILLDQEQ